MHNKYHIRYYEFDPTTSKYHPTNIQCARSFTLSNAVKALNKIQRALTLTNLTLSRSVPSRLDVYITAENNKKYLCAFYAIEEEQDEQPL